MVFSGAVFLFIFLPIVILGYFLFRGNARNYWLLGTSLFFYAWNRPEFIWILFGSIAVNYIASLGLEKTQSKSGRKWILITAVALNLLLLYYFKYFNFTIRVLEKFTRHDFQVAEVLLPIGISFFTFQGLSYLVDVYRGDVPAQHNLAKYAMYISMFPQLVAGPIVRYIDIAKEIDDRHSSREDIVYGVRRFILGLFKKIIIADTLALTVNFIFGCEPHTNSVMIAWLGILVYAMQIFFDFSGYSDMAIGMGRIFGFHFLENFNYPYISRSITEFWRRWHISLSSFFRDYVYIPLGGNRKQVYFNLAVVFTLTGIWHGAYYTYIAWGVWHGFFIVAERILKNTRRKALEGKEPKQPNPSLRVLSSAAGYVYTMVVVLIGWVMFRTPNVPYGIQYLMSMFGLNNLSSMNYISLSFYLDQWTATVLGLALVMATPLPETLYRTAKKYVPETVFDMLQNAVLLLLLALCMLQVASNSYSEFIYFQF